MKFNGIKVRFNCKNGEQYQQIGDFWNHMTFEYPTYELKGVGCNWHNDSFDYIIGDFAQLDFNVSKIQESYADADYVSIELPDKNWQVHNCKIEKLSELYGEIYMEGPLDYEIEEFYANGDCKISICRL